MLVLIVVNEFNEKAHDSAFQLIAYLSSQGIEHKVIYSSALLKMASEVDISFSLDEVDLAIVLGGDGTILKTARLLDGLLVPILGINFGHLGFLANSSEDGVIPLVMRTLAGELKEERRTNLKIHVETDDSLSANRIIDSEDEDGESVGVDLSGVSGAREFFALNEFALTRGTFGRMLSMSYSVSDVKIADLSGDGMIISSATGSTAYSLAAGGPIVSPGFNGLIVQPLSVHGLRSRSLLTSSSDVVRIELADDRSKRAAVLFADGECMVLDHAISAIEVMRGSSPTILLYDDSEHFYKYTAKTFF